MLQVRSRMTPPTLQHPPRHNEKKQGMLHHRKAHIGIREQPRYGCERDRKKVIICPLPMSQEIHDAMGEHADKERECRSIEHSRQGEAGTHKDKRMQTYRHGMQCRMMQERMECRSHGRVRQVFQVMRTKPRAKNTSGKMPPMTASLCSCRGRFAYNRYPITPAYRFSSFFRTLTAIQRFARNASLEKSRAPRNHQPRSLPYHRSLQQCLRSAPFHSGRNCVIVGDIKKETPAERKGHS